MDALRGAGPCAGLQVSMQVRLCLWGVGAVMAYHGADHGLPIVTYRGTWPIMAVPANAA